MKPPINDNLILMKPTINDKLDMALDLAPESETDIVVTQEVAIHPPTEVACSGDADKDMEADFGVARVAFYGLVDKSTELVDHANFFAKEHQDARSVEAAAAAQKEHRENILALVALHKVRKDIERASVHVSGGDTNITQNTVLVGTTGDLMRLTKEMNAMNAQNLLKESLKTIDVPASDATKY